jgi:hypothetical protein
MSEKTEALNYAINLVEKEAETATGPRLERLRRYQRHLADMVVRDYYERTEHTR